MGQIIEEADFAIIIDEAHSSQGGRTSSAMAQALGDHEDGDDDDTFEDKINRIIEQKRLLTNASYFAFTATPKNKTLELFWHTVAAARWHGKASVVPQLCDETGD